MSELQDTFIPGMIEMSTFRILENRRPALRFLFSCTGVSCTGVSCTDVSCTDVSCTGVSCTDVSCTDVSCTDVSCTGFFLFYVTFLYF